MKKNISSGIFIIVCVFLNNVICQKAFSQNNSTENNSSMLNIPTPAHLSTLAVRYRQKATTMEDVSIKNKPTPAGKTSLPINIIEDTKEEALLRNNPPRRKK